MTAREENRLIRPLEGYRAIAIIGVLLFHFGIEPVSGGFIGVDLFFVISGFIITKKIYAEMVAGEFSLRRFYFKRFRRLFPALLVTVIGVLVAGYVFLTPNAYDGLARNALASIVSLANIKFWLAEGYFETASSLNPLLHMWSLSVEEQFYLAWPAALLLLTAVLKLGPKATAFGILIILAVSFAATVIVAQAYPSAAFFWFPFRVFQFMAGAMFAVGAFSPTFLSRSSLMTATGFALFLAACGLLTGESSIAVAGAVASLSGALLVTTMDSSLSRLLFGNGLMVLIGRHSYSLYLVHWPLVSFYALETGGSFDIRDQIILALGSVILAILLRFFIEQPLRVTKGETFRRGLSATGLATLILTASLVSSGYIVSREGFAERVAGPIRALMQQDPSYPSKVRFGDCFLDKERHSISDLKPFCYESDPADKNLLIIGSSFAADLYPGIASNLDGWEVYQVTSAACPPLFRRRGRQGQLCDDVRNFVWDELIPRYSYDLILLGGAGERTRLAKTVENLDQHGLDYVFTGPRPRLPEHPWILIERHGTLDGLDEWMNSQLIWNGEIGHPLGEDHYISLRNLLCDKEGVCRWRSGTVSYYQDKNHFSPAASDVLGKNISAWIEKEKKIESGRSR